MTNFDDVICVVGIVSGILSFGLVQEPTSAIINSGRSFFIGLSRYTPFTEGKIEYQYSDTDQKSEELPGFFDVWILHLCEVVEEQCAIGRSEPCSEAVKIQYGHNEITGCHNDHDAGWIAIIDRHYRYDHHCTINKYPKKWIGVVDLY